MLGILHSRALSRNRKSNICRYIRTYIGEAIPLCSEGPVIQHKAKVLGVPNVPKTCWLNQTGWIEWLTWELASP